MPNADAARQGTSLQAIRWAIASLPLAPFALVAYLFSEWLFFITKPSPTAALPLAAQITVLLKSPLSALWPFLTVQAVASLISLVAYPRFRNIALLPAGAVCIFSLSLPFCIRSRKTAPAQLWSKKSRCQLHCQLPA
jgi:hypothetical protein